MKGTKEFKTPLNSFNSKVEGEGIKVHGVNKSRVSMILKKKW